MCLTKVRETSESYDVFCGTDIGGMTSTQKDSGKPSGQP